MAGRECGHCIDKTGDAGLQGRWLRWNQRLQSIGVVLVGHKPDVRHGMALAIHGLVTGDQANRVAMVLDKRRSVFRDQGLQFLDLQDCAVRQYPVRPSPLLSVQT